MCLLHANLCVVNGMLQRTILNYLDKLVEPNVAPQADQLYKLWSSNGVYFKKAKLVKKGKKLEAHDLAVKAVGLTGRSGEIIYRLFQRVQHSVSIFAYVEHQM